MVFVEFLAIALVIILGVVGDYIFKITNIPDIIWLLLLGLLIGPVFKFIDVSLFEAALPYFTAIAIMIILFQGGLVTNIYVLIKESPRSMTLAIVNLLLCMLLVAVVMSFFGWNLMEGLLLGAILGGTSSPIVVALTSRYKLSKKLKTLLNLESTLTDALTIIVALTIVQIIAFGSYSIRQISNSLLGGFSIGAVLGFVFGIAWLAFLEREKKLEFSYMLTLAMLLILYSVVEMAGGSGAMAALIFGVVLANGKDIASMLKLKRHFKISKNIEKFHQEIYFLVKTFFFVYLGMLISLENYFAVAIGFLIAFVIWLSRFISIKLSLYKAGYSKREMMFASTVIPRGLAAAVLSQIPLQYNLANASTFVNVIVSSIFFTIVFTTIASSYAYKKFNINNK